MKRHLIRPNNPNPRHMMLMTIISAYPAINSIPDTNQLIPDNGALQTPRRSGASVSRVGTIVGNKDSPQSTIGVASAASAPTTRSPRRNVAMQSVERARVLFFHMTLH
mmetsp:Transcript_29821/g.46767  ORF Transcript_29821/g.46767 Transcript_29821/m.46767 type:complete len:108 (+) Transcript_29821:88-411(+)